MDEGDDFDYNGLDGVVFDEEEAGSLGPLNKALKSRRPARCTSSATARSSCGAGTIFSCALAVASAKFSEGNSRINLEHLLEKTSATRRPVRRPRSREMLSQAPATAGAVEVGVRAARRALGGTRRTSTTPPL